jgi:acyl-CoA thioesterase FadM
VHVTIEDVSRSTIGYRHLIMRGDTLIAEGTMTAVYVDKKPGETLKSAQIPPAIVEKLQNAAK